MTTNPIHLTRDDYSKLRLLLATAPHSPANTGLQKLRAELDRAIVIESGRLPFDVVTMDSTVEYQDLGSGEIEEYTITFPERANIDQKRVSILAPIGTALIGCRVGDVVSWSTPGGIRQLRVCRVSPPPPAPTTTPPVSTVPNPVR